MIIMATPDGIPLFLTTFLRNNELQVALQRISHDWRKNAASTQKLAENWSEGFSNAQKLSKYKNVTSLNDYFQLFFKNNADETYGGLKENNKFTYLRQYSVFFNLGLVPLNHIKKQCSKLLMSPLFDFVEGGVHRYSLGPNWSKPQTEKIFIDQVYFIKLLIQLYNKTGDNLYSQYAKYNLDFILRSFFNNKSGFFYVSLNSGAGKKSSYYMFSNVFLDEISPLKFYRVQYTKEYSGVSLVQPIDLFAIDKSVLRTYRKNRPTQLVPDIFFSIPDHVEFLKMLDLYDNTFKTQYARIYSPVILKQLELELSKPQNLNDLLYMYDVFSMTGNDELLQTLKLLIASNISDVFPYDVNQFSLNEHLLNPDYIDQYSYNQSIYFLLAYFDELELSISKDTVCSEIEDRLVLPWNQLSYVDSLIQFCL